MIMTIVKLPEKTYAKLVYLARSEKMGIRKKASALLEFMVEEQYSAKTRGSRFEEYIEKKEKGE